MEALSPPSFLSRQVQRGDYFFLNLSATGEGGLEVVCGGREVCGSDYEVDRAGFPWWSVEFVAAGHGTALIGGQEVPLVPGTVFYYGPSLPHRIKVDAGSTMVKYFVDFTGSQAPSLLHRAFPAGEASTATAGALVQRVYEDFKMAAEALSQTRTEVCNLLLRRLLAMLPDRIVSSAGGAELLQAFQTVKARLAGLAVERPTVAEAARACGVSTSYLERLFRRFGQDSPHRYLLSCRMAFAASLLLDRRLLVKEIAALAGYEDQYHFSRAFKSVYKQSPQAFRTLRS